MAKEVKKAPRRIRWKVVFGVTAAGLAIASTAVAAIKVRDHVAADPAYLLTRDNKDAITFEGLVYASRNKVHRVFAEDFEHSIFSVPLDARRRRLLAIDWVEDASVARVWPDRLVVRLRERRPVAFVFFRSGVLLIDRYGVFLEVPPQAQFSFPVLGGVREDETEEQRAKHVSAMLRMQDDMGYLAKDISEVNAADPEDMRIIAKVADRPVELMLGESNFGRRYQNFLKHFPEIEKTSPAARSFDLRLDDRITAKE